MTTAKRPATETLTSDVRTLLDREPFDQTAVAYIREALNRDPSRYRTLRDAASALLDRHGAELPPDAHLRYGVASVLLGRHTQAIEHLSKAGESGLAAHHLGLALEAIQRWDAAAKAFEKAAELGHLPEISRLRRVGCLRRAGKTDEAAAALDAVDPKTGGSAAAEYHYQRGAMLFDEGALVDAAAEFEKTLAIDRDHAGALFQLAYINDLQGNDETALEQYERCVQKPPVPLGALINLGVLYEDGNKFREAEQCYKRVLDAVPNHPRARLFHKDCHASKDQYYDEETHERYNLLRKVMEVPITDFELSVRARNVLKRMNIRTLGDLTRITEATLLSSKNFGETSLSEIKEILATKGLQLGMAIENNPDRPAPGPGAFRPEPPVPLSPEEEAKLRTPISELNLSVRARKCMSKLGVQTVGELLTYTGDQLLECKNFGVTSLNEVRERLTEYGLKLKNE